MLKSIATARSECTAKQENKVSYNTDYIASQTPYLTDLFGNDFKRDQNADWKKKYLQL